MGATCGCCASDNDTVKTTEIEHYIKKWHMNPDKIIKHNKNEYELAKQCFDVKTVKGLKQMEILDDIARR